MMDLIRVRKNQNYLMSLMIAQNPWVKEPQELVNILKNSSQMEMTAMSNDIEKYNETIDKQGFRNLKDKLKRSSHKILVK